MSRAAIVMVLRELLHHQPTPEEYERGRALLMQACPSGRLYIPERNAQGELFNKARDLKAMGWSIRHIAKELGVSKSGVHRMLCDCPTLSGEVGQTPA